MSDGRSSAGFVTIAADELTHVAASALADAGMEPDRARIVAEILVEADLMGHDTHGVGLLPAYLKALRDGSMRASGDFAVLKDRGALALWDGGWLSGVWLTAMAVDAAVDKARQFGVGAVSIGRAHHNACLAAYLQRATSRGLMVIIATSDPTHASVAPFGGLDRLLGPDPIAIGIPTEADPILIDTSTSTTSNGVSGRAARMGVRLPGPWLQDAEGRPTDDPKILTADPPGSILPTGGLDHGHKGFAMGLLVEALTNGLSGAGRRQAIDRWTVSVFVQVIDPEFAGGLGGFAAEATHLAEACRQSRPAPGHAAVRMPGDAALARKRAALPSGVRVRAEIARTIGLIDPGR